MSFRKYGGINHSATNNIVKSHFSTSDNQIITNTFGDIGNDLRSVCDLFNLGSGTVWIGFGGGGSG